MTEHGATRIFDADLQEALHRSGAHVRRTRKFLGRLANRDPPKKATVIPLRNDGAKCDPHSTEDKP
jgi:hypothetical protein